MDRKTENLLYHINKTLFENEYDSETAMATGNYLPSGGQATPNPVSQQIINAAKGAKNLFTVTDENGNPREVNINRFGNYNTVLPSDHEASQGAQPQPVPASVDGPSAISSYLDQGINWAKANPGLAVGAGAGVPLALAGGYLAYKKLKNKNK